MALLDGLPLSIQPWLGSASYTPEVRPLPSLCPGGLLIPGCGPLGPVGSTSVWEAICPPACIAMHRPGPDPDGAPAPRGSRCVG